ncbi:MAG: hypothetical protein C4554_04200 [Dethiobacter sp.]|nr:MAG: hypothetical protein C4554_04200 [Dethiobacter sp.]
MVKIVNNPELKIKERLGRRGFSEEECQKVLQSSSSGVIILNKRSLRRNSLKDFVGIKSC